jgi:ERCC4-related helicase
MKTKNENVPVIVFTGIVWEAEMVKNILENDGIQAFLNNEFVGTLAPWYTTPGPGSVDVVVSGLDYEKAKLLVDEFEKDRYE